MPNKKINELASRTPSLTDLLLVGDPSSGFSYKCTVHDLADIIETDIGDSYVTIATTQTVSGAKTFSNILTLTSVNNAGVDTDKFLVLSGINAVTYRTGSEVLSDIGGQGTITLTTTGTSGAATFSTNTLNIPQYQGAITLTTTGTSGAATLVGNTLNIPNYAPDLSGYVPTSRTITINGTTQDLSANRTFNVGTVTSVAASAGTGISISGSPITSSGTLTITNTAPDQVVALTAGTGVSISGTYPNFTITNTAPSLGGTVTSVALSAPTGFSVTGSPVTSSGTLGLTFAVGYSLPTTASQTNWDTAYANRITILTTTGSSGAATLISNTLNIPNYTLAGLGGISLSSLSASAPLSYNSGTGVFSISQANTTTNGFLSSTDWNTFNNKLSAAVTSLNGLTASTQTFATGTSGTDFDISSTTSTHTFNLPTASATNRGALSSADWSTFNGKQSAITLTTTGTSGAATFVSNTLNIPQYQAQGNYITSLTGEATGSGAGAASVTLTNSAVIGKILTGLNITGGTVTATDSILTAFGKVQNQINGLAGGVTYQGTWNASTNTPTLTSSAGTKGFYYVVSVAGSTNLNGITDWKLGDWAIYNGTSWEKVDNTDAVVSVNGYTGAVSLSTTDIAEGTNLYFTNARARSAISLTTTGTSGAATYDNTTGVLNIPQYGGGSVSGTTNYIAKFTSSTAVGNSLMFDTGTGIFIGNGQSSATPQLGLIEGTDGSGTNIAGAEFRIQGGQGTGTGAGGPITFYTSAAGTAGSTLNSATERMRLDADGNFGIGTITPGSRFDVTNNVNTAYSAANTLTSGQTMRIANTSTSSNISTNLVLVATGAGGGTGLGTISGLNTATGSLAITFGTRNSGSNVIERVRITSDGNLAIATTTPGSTLQVNGNAAIGYSASTAAPTNGLAVAGNVSIGVNSSATYPLTVRTAGTNTGHAGNIVQRLESTATGRNVSLQFSDNVTNATFISMTDGNMLFTTAAPASVNSLFLSNTGIAFFNGFDVSATPSTAIVSATGGTGTNIAGAEFRIRGGASTGSGAGGPITFYTSASGSAGTGVNAATERMRIDGAGRTTITTSGNIRSLNLYETNGRFCIYPYFNSINGAILQSLNLAENVYQPMTFEASNHYFTNTNGVGISTQTVGSRLQVNGNAAIGYSASTAAPTNGLAVAGQVGIATTNPKSYTAMTVNGQLLTLNNLLVNAGNTIKLNAYYNSATVTDKAVSAGFAGDYFLNNSTGSLLFRSSATSFAADADVTLVNRMEITSSGETKLTPSANTAMLSTTGAYSLTGANAQSLIDLAGTWNTTGNPTAIKLNITNTASGATAYLMDLQVGAATQFRVTKAGAIRTSAPTTGTANDWKLGSVVAGTTAFDTTKWVEVEIGGTLYRVALVTLP